MGTKKRDYLYDNIKGCMVIFIVLIHFISSTFKDYFYWSQILNTAVALVSMSIMMFISGFFSKKPRTNTVEMGVRNLIIPYGITCLLLVPINLHFEGETEFHFFTTPFALWYLVVLFGMRLIVETVDRVRFSMTLALVTALLISTVEETQNFATITRIATFFPFFLMGYRFRPDMIKDLRTVRWPFRLLLGLFALGLTLFYSFLIQEMEWPANVYQNKTTYAAEGMGDVLGIVLRLYFYVLGVFAIFGALAVSSEKKCFLSKVGKNSLLVYIFHTLLVPFLQHMEFLRGSQWWQVAAVLAIVAVTVAVLSMDWLNGLFQRLVKILGNLLFRGADRQR